MIVFLTGCVFLLSGIAGLIYEVVWFRMLATTFGATGPALAATTASFMAGLGLGSRLMGQRADRLQNPIRVYALLELLIAGCAVAMPLAIRGVADLQGLLFDAGDSSVARAVLQFGLILLALVIPTALMGATLPVLCRAVIRSDAHLGRRFTWLYGINTLGAAAGAVLAGFVLIPSLGISNTVLVAIGLNLVATVLAVAFAGRRFSRPAVTELSATLADSTDLPQPATAAVTASAQLIRIAVFLCGFVGLATQYLWTRALVFGFDRLKNTTYSFSAVLAVTLIGLVTGTALTYAVIDRLRRPWQAFSVTVGLMGLSIIGSVAVLTLSPPLADTIDPRTLRLDFTQAVWQVVQRTATVLGIPTLLMGAALPLAIRSAVRSEHAGQQVGGLYAWNTWGAVAGAILAAFVVTPALGLVRGLIALGIVQLLLTAWIQRSRRAVAAAVVGVAVAAVASLFVIPESVWQLQSLRAGETIVGYRDSATATVAVIENDRGERRICVDDVPVAGTSNIMQTDQKSLAHWSMLLAETPETALTVGFGSGGASWSFLLHDSLKQLDCVEICRDVPRMAGYLTDANHGLLERDDPRYRLIIADARAYLADTDRRYDAIVSDCTDLRYRSSANLYDLEYFQLCRQALRPGGCTVIWMPLGGLSTESFRLTVRTFVHVFPETSVFYLHNRWTHYVLLVGHQQQPALTVDRVRQHLAEPDVRADMAEIGMTDPYKVIGTFLTSGRHLQPAISGDELNTEDNPVLEFAVPRFDMGPWSAQRNLDFLRLYRAPLTHLLAADLPEEEIRQCLAYQQAAEHILSAQTAERAFNLESATRHYLAAQQLTPEDEAIADALKFPELRELAQRGQPTAWLLLGRTQQLQGQFQDAAESVRQFRHYLNQLQPPLTSEQSEWRDQARLWQPTAKIWEEEIRRNQKSSDAAIR